MSGGAIGGLVSGIFGPLFSAITGWLGAKRHEKQLTSLGKTETERDNAVAGQAEVATARGAADAARIDLDRHPERVREHDPEERTDGS